MSEHIIRQLYHRIFFISQPAISPVITSSLNTTVRGARTSTIHPTYRVLLLRGILNKCPF